MNSALELLIQLSTSKTVMSDLKKEIEFESILNRFPTNIKVENSTDKDIYRNIKILLDQSNLKFHLNEPKSVLNATHESSTNNSQCILVSYHRDDRTVCSKIKKQLESNGYIILMDVDDLHGSRLDLFTKAVEKSSCVLICATEKYKQNVDCQLEAKYSFKKLKTILLVLESSPVNSNDWLNILMNDKASVDFTKNSFDECITILKTELGGDASLKSDISVVKTVEKWTVDDVNNWFIKNKLNLIIFEYFKPCSGKILKQMHQTKKNSSDYFYESLKEIEHVKFNEIIRFTTCLDELFNDKVKA